MNPLSVTTAWTLHVPEMSESVRDGNDYRLPTIQPSMEDSIPEIIEQARALREGPDKDPAKAAELLRTAADSGDIGAASSLGYMYTVGEGVQTDKQQAERYLRQAAEGGDTAAMCNLGVLLSDPQWFDRAADLGSLRGMKNLASAYATGMGVPIDKEAAADLYQRAAGLGDVDSMVVLATMKRNGDGIPQDIGGAASLFRQAADLGDPDAQYDLAMMLDAGDGIPQDREEAARLFALSAEQGDTDACLCIGGICYENGDYQGAERWFMDAALKGDVKAMYNLGLIYMDGNLGEPDPGKAEEWLESAASEGFAFAQSMLGTMCINRKDHQNAQKWLEMASSQGEPGAMYNLAALGLSGQIQMDDSRAMELLTQSASAGVPEAIQLLSMITKG